MESSPQKCTSQEVTSQETVPQENSSQKTASQDSISKMASELFDALLQAIAIDYSSGKKTIVVTWTPPSEITPTETNSPPTTKINLSDRELRIRLAILLKIQEVVNKNNAKMQLQALTQDPIAIRGEKIKELRKQHHLSQTNLAESLKVTKQSISKWERGQVSTISFESAVSLAKSLQCTLDYITGSSFHPRQLANGLFDPFCSSNDEEHDTISSFYNLLVKNPSAAESISKLWKCSDAVINAFATLVDQLIV